MVFDYTFHSHTYRCNHAVGDIEDYVIAAIKNGYQIYGVSDHVLLPNVLADGTRGDYFLFDDYVETYQRVKEKYSSSIKMYLGFECEYSDYYYDYYLSLLKEKGFDYLICGQHNGFDSEDGKPFEYFFNNPTSSLEERLERFKTDIIKAMKSGLFLYIAHPDVFFEGATEITPIYKKITKEVIEAAIENNVVFELNIHGLIRYKVRNGITYIKYPCLYFWKEVAKTNIKVVHGGDFHDPKEIGNKDITDQVEKLVRECSIKFVDIKEVFAEYKERIATL